jgi:predicted nucleotidyltransferase
MMGRIHIDIPSEKIVEFCEKWGIQEFAFFGSVLRDNFNSSSDIDVLVTFHEKAKTTLFDIVRMENELTELFGRKVDLVSRRGIESSRNYLRRDAILSSAESVYAA